MTRKIQQVLALATCLLLFAVAAINRDGRLWGHDLQAENSKSLPQIANDTLTTSADGSIVVNTTPLGKNIVGYGGRTPLKIHIKDGVVTQVELLENNETPDFLERAAVILDHWEGLRVADALTQEVDAVSGATYTSKALIGNMRKGLEYVLSSSVSSSFDDEFSWEIEAKQIAALIVILMAAIIPIFLKDKRYRVIQLILNVVVIGFWCGTFVSYSLLTGLAANGIHSVAAAVPVAMVLIAFVYPLLGRQNHYCTHICPLGSAQELAGMVTRKRLSTPAKTVQWLTNFKNVLWGVLLALLLTGIFTQWTDYELFSAFSFQSVSVVVTIVAVVFLILSVFVPRPYCRFVCPTGTLFKLLQIEK